MHKGKDLTAAGGFKLKQRQYQTLLIASFGLILSKWELV
jgi:hypothetical protein